MPGARVVTEPVVGFRANLPLTVTRRWARTALWFGPSAPFSPGYFPLLLEDADTLGLRHIPNSGAPSDWQSLRRPIRTTR